MPIITRKKQSDNTQPEFEKLRQAQETHNEVIVNYIQIVVFAMVLVANVSTRYSELAPYKASNSLLTFVVLAFASRIALFFYFRSNPFYNRYRKYLISTLDIGLYTTSAAMLGYQHDYPWMFLSLFAVCTYAMLVALSGLRYDTKVVIFNGVTTVVLSAIIFSQPLPQEFRGPLIMVSFLTLGCVTVCTAYSVASLIRIHKEASVKENLARFLPPELVEQVMTEPDLLHRKTERRTATVIFTDIRGFTRFSEMLSPEQVVEFLNEFLEEMTAAIMDHRGMVDKYIGDAVMGVFGVPTYADDHALRALKSAMEMRDRLNLLNIGLKERGLPQLSIGIGLHTGELLIGAIGSTRRLDYTVIGDTVNVASRIEGMTRSYPVEILMSDSTSQEIGSALKLYQIATVQVKNRVEPLTLWSPDPPKTE